VREYTPGMCGLFANPAATKLIRTAQGCADNKNNRLVAWWGDVAREDSIHMVRCSAFIGLLLAGALLGPFPVCAADEAAAQDLAKTSGCFKCHGVDKKKDGPALRDAAAKYKGDPEAESKLIYHVTSGEKVKFDDGHEEEHKKVKTRSSSETLNLVQWILALQGGTKR
jgi:cytochrome c